MQLIFLGENVHCRDVHFQAEQRIFDKEEEGFIIIQEKRRRIVD